MLHNTEYGDALFTFTAKQVKDHLSKRAEHHTKRNEALVAEAKELEEKGKAAVDEAETVSDRMSIKGSSSYISEARARDMKLESARNHARKAAKFFFLAERFASGETSGVGDVVKLNLQEMERLEFIVD